MVGKCGIPKYAIRLVVLDLFAGTIFFGVLFLFIPEDRKGQIYRLMIFKYQRLAQDICPAVVLGINNWRKYEKAIYGRSAL